MSDALTVLVVDDDASDRWTALRALRAGDSAVRIEEVESCAEAMAWLEGDSPPDAVLLDDQLPDGDGLGLIRQARAQGLPTPIIMLTGQGDEMLAVELMKAGAADYLAKDGLTPEGLWRSLRGVLRFRQAQAEAAGERRAKQEAQQQNEERLRVLYDTTSSPDLPFERKLDRLLEEGCRQFGLETGLLTRIEGERYEVIHAWPPGTPPAGLSCPLDLTFCRETLRRRRAFGLEYAGESEWKSHPAYAAWGVEAYLGTVVRTDGHAVGTLAFTSTRPRPVPFTAGDREYIRLMAQWVGGELQRRQAEEALRASEERFRLLMENVLDYAIFVTDPEGRVADWSAGAERILGYKAEEIVGRDAAVIFTPEDRARSVPQREMAAAEEEGRADDERWHLRKDGRRFFASGVMTPLRDGSGTLRGFSKILRDVTDRKRIADELRASEERYRSLISATAQIVWTASAAGEFDRLQPQWADFTGQTFDQYQGWGWLTAVHPDDQWRVAEAWSAAVANRTPYEVEHRLRRPDGVYRLMSARAVPVLEDDGAIREWVGVYTDITERQLAEARRRFLAEASVRLAASLDYDSTLADIAQLAVATLADWCIVDLLDAEGLLRRVSTAHADPVQRERARAWEARHHPADPAAPNGAPEVVRTGHSEMVSDISDALLAASARDPEHLQFLRERAPRSYICVPLMARDHALGAITLVTAESGRRYEAADLELAEELARRAALAVDNARLFHETRARAERESLINRIGRTLRGSLDPEEILRIATAEVGGALGVSRCTWARIDPGGDALEVAPQQYAAPGVSPYAAAYPLSAYPPEALALWQSGQTVAVADIDADPRAAFARDLMSPQAALRAFIAAPVFMRGAWAGLFIVQQTDRPREWTQDEVGLMTSIADMLALALENARLYTREHRVADILQAALLPDIPDHLLGLDLAKDYSSGLEEAQVGGDLYDAFPLSDGRLALVMADVSGKGLAAAVLTATVKYSLRAFAAEAAAPSLVIRRLNRTLRSEATGLNEHFVTLFYAVYDPLTGRLTYSSAGHEAQIIKRAAGGATLLPSNGPILGLVDHRYDQDVDYLHPGDSLILFTDGLTEARAAGSRELLDLERVTTAIAGLDPGCGAGAIVAYLKQFTEDWTGGRPQDDLALLVARRPPLPPQPESSVGSGTTGLTDAPVPAPVPVGDAGSGETLFDFALPSCSDAAAEVRQAVAHWMDSLGFDLAQTEDFQTAVTEAVANAVRHGSPRGGADQLRVCGFRGADDAFAVEVADTGPGLAAPDAPPVMPAPDAPSGRGLPLMSLLADEMSVLPSEAGLRVRLVKRHPAGDGK